MDDRTVGSFHSKRNAIDKGIRITVFQLNQSGWTTFTSDDGGGGARLPKFGVICDSFELVSKLISYTEKYNGNIWYEISNRWYKPADIPEHEVKYDDKTNNHIICRMFELTQERTYFIVFKSETLDEIKAFAKYLCKVNNPAA